MKASHVLAALFLAASSTLALAGNSDTTSLSGKAMNEQPGNTGAGMTADPTAKPDESSVSGQAMRQLPGNTGAGMTAQPTAKPSESSLSGEAMRDHPGNK